VKECVRKLGKMFFILHINLSPDNVIITETIVII